MFEERRDCSVFVTVGGKYNHSVLVVFSCLPEPASKKTERLMFVRAESRSCVEVHTVS